MLPRMLLPVLHLDGARVHMSCPPPPMHVKLADEPREACAVLTQGVEWQPSYPYILLHQLNNSS